MNNATIKTPTCWGEKRPSVGAWIMSRDEWLKHREGGVGATEAIAVCGLSKWSSPLLAWQRRKGYAPKPEYSNAMHMGHLLEPIVARLWEEHTGLQIAPESEGDIIVSAADDTPWRLCSPDRWTADGVLVECKTTAQPVDESEPPLEWYAQLQYQMAVCGASEGWIAWLVNGREFGCARFERNEELIADMLATVDAYWLDCCIGDQAPADTVASDALLRYPSPVVEVHEASDELAEMIAEYKRVKAEAKELTDQAEAMGEQVRAAIAQYGKVEYMGKTIATFTRNKPSVKLDSKRLQAEHPDLCAGYMVEVEGARVLRIK